MLKKDYKARVNEMVQEIDSRDQELLEVKCNRDEIETELKHLRDEHDDMQFQSVVHTTKYNEFDKNRFSLDTQSRVEKTQSTYNQEMPSAVGKDYEIGSIYGKLTSELSNLRSEINNMKSEQKSKGKGKIVRNQINQERFQEVDEHLFGYARKNNKFDDMFNEYENDSLIDRIKSEAVEHDFKVALASDTEDEASQYHGYNTKNEADFDYGRSENQSPNQNVYYNTNSYREGNDRHVLSDIKNTVSSDRNYRVKIDEIKKLVPALNIDKIND